MKVGRGTAAVDVRARKRIVLGAAMRLFARHGYAAVTYGMIAEASGVARTVLYRYFRNKRRIFDAAILEETGRVAARNDEIMHSGESASVRLRHLCSVVTAVLFDNREFLSAIIDFVMSMDHDGKDVSRRIPQFTGGLKRMLRTLVAEGVHRGEFDPSTDPERVADTLYALFESAVLRLTISKDAVNADVLAQIDGVLRGLGRKAP